jgi:hypothetical protein
MSTRFNPRRLELWIALVALAVFSIPLTGVALQHEPAPPVSNSTVDQPPARIEGEVIEKSTEELFEEREKPEAEEPIDPCGAAVIEGDTVDEVAKGPSQTEVVYKLDHMLDHPDDYIGKTITVDGEMHRQFTDKVFTIEDDGFWRDEDMLVISLTPMSESVIPLQDSFERGKKVRVTGVVRPYDREKLECLFGPLNLESREGHSFTKNPVLIIGYKEPAPVAAVTMPTPPPPVIELAPLPPPMPEPAPAPPAVAEEVQEEPPAALPRTASNVQLAALAGLVSLLTAGLVHFARRQQSRNK